jgi:hypothetical protein
MKADRRNRERPVRAELQLRADSVGSAREAYAVTIPIGWLKPKNDSRMRLMTP